MTDVVSVQAILAQVEEFRQQSSSETDAADSLEAQARHKRERAEILMQCANDLERMLKRLGHTEFTGAAAKTGPRYNKPGLTSEMIGKIFQQPGIAKEALLTWAGDKEGSRGTANKMLGRAIENLDVKEEEGKLWLTEQGESIWRQSPLFRQ